MNLVSAMVTFFMQSCTPIDEFTTYFIQQKSIYKLTIGFQFNRLIDHYCSFYYDSTNDNLIIIISHIKIQCILGFFSKNHIFKKLRADFLFARFYKKMIKADKRSVLTLLDYQLQSLSQYVKIADNQYYLAQLHSKTNNNSIYTWEEISVLKSRYYKLLNEFNFTQYIEKGKQIQLRNKWPDKKMIALMEIKEKFWDEHSESQEQLHYQFLDEELNIQRIKQQLKNSKRREKEKEKKMMKMKNFEQDENQNSNQKSKQNDSSSLRGSFINKTINKKDYLPIYNKFLQKPNIKSSKSSQLSFKNEKMPKEFSLNKANKDKQENNVWSSDQGRQQYLRIRNFHISNIRGQKQLNYEVQNILGEIKVMAGNKLKKSHLFQVIVFLQKCLKVNKRQLINQNK